MQRVGLASFITRAGLYFVLAPFNHGGPGPLKFTVNVGYRFWPFWALMDVPKSTQIGGLVGLPCTGHLKKSLEVCISVPNL